MDFIQDQLQVGDCVRLRKDAQLRFLHKNIQPNEIGTVIALETRPVVMGSHRQIYVKFLNGDLSLKEYFLDKLDKHSE